MNKRPLVLAILDGFAINNYENGNAPLLANMENLYAIHNNYPWTLLNASGPDAGLIDGAYGTCQNNHEIIGAGRVVPSYLSEIHKSIEDKSFYEKAELIKTIEEAKKRNKKYIHIIGLISQSPIVGYEDEVFAICKLIYDNGLIPIVHAITDGRDVKKKSALLYLSDLYNTLKLYNGILADISGRFYALDTQNHWSRTIKSWNVMSNNDGDSFDDFEVYIEDLYNTSITDEFFPPQYNSKYAEESKIIDDDVIIVTTYRYDHQLLSLINNMYEEEYDNYIHRNNLYLTLLTPSFKDIKANIVFNLKEQKNTLGEVLANNNLKQLRIAENLRFNDITYQFDGRRDLNLAYEEKVNISSIKTPTYDLNPELSAIKITDYITDYIDKYDVVIANYANPDILGHTGNVESAIKGMKIIDLCIGSLYEKVVKEKNGCLMITSDHGNCEQMLDENGNNITYHTKNKVPFILCERKLHLRLDNDANISDISPTILDYLGLKIPEEMSGKTLFTKPSFITNFLNTFKRKDINLEIKIINQDEVNKILETHNQNIGTVSTYVDENDFSALDV